MRLPILFFPCFVLGSLNGDDWEVGSLFEDELEDGWSLQPELRMTDVEKEITALSESRRELDILTSTWKFNYEHIMLPGESYPTLRSLNSLARTENSAVFTVRPDETRAVVVYRRYCYRSSRPFDMSVVDFWFLHHLKHTGLVPEVYRLSNPFPLVVDGKIPTKPCNPVEGGERPTPHVRFILMEFIPSPSVWDIVSTHGKLPVKEAAKLAIQMVRTIEKIHHHRVVHGDAHMGNFIPSEKGMKMIDFERARIFHPEEYDEASQCEEPKPPQKLVATALNSPWEAKGCMVSFRDDIHRILVSMGIMIHGEEYFDYFGRLGSGVYTPEGRFDRAATLQALTEWAHLRNNAMIFILPGFALPVLDSTKNLLHDLQTLVINMDISTVPDYESIVGTLLKIVDE